MHLGVGVEGTVADFVVSAVDFKVLDDVIEGRPIVIVDGSKAAVVAKLQIADLHVTV